MKSIFNVKKALTYFGILTSGAPSLDNSSCYDGAINKSDGKSTGNFHMSQPIAIPKSPAFCYDEVNYMVNESGRRTPLDADWNEYVSDEFKYISSGEFADQEGLGAAGSGSEASCPSNCSGENFIDHFGSGAATEDEYVNPHEVREYDITLYPLREPLYAIAEEDEEETPPIRNRCGGEESSEGRSEKLYPDYFREGGAGLMSKGVRLKFAKLSRKGSKKGFPRGEA